MVCDFVFLWGLCVCFLWGLFWFIYCLPVFFPKEREKEGKGMELHGKGVGKNLEAVLGEGSVISV